MKYEYMQATYSYGTPMSFDEWLNSYGEDGWLLVAVLVVRRGFVGLYLFAREKGRFHG